MESFFLPWHRSPMPPGRRRLRINPSSARLRSLRNRKKRKKTGRSLLCSRQAIASCCLPRTVPIGPTALTVPTVPTGRAPAGRPIPHHRHHRACPPSPIRPRRHRPRPRRRHQKPRRRNRRLPRQKPAAHRQQNSPSPRPRPTLWATAICARE